MVRPLTLLGATGVAQGVGPPTRTSTSPTSLSDNTCAQVRPPLSERATCVPDACQATQTVPSERSTATDGSVAFVCALGETCVVNPVDVPVLAISARIPSDAPIVKRTKASNTRGIPTPNCEREFRFVIVGYTTIRTPRCMADGCRGTIYFGRIFRRSDQVFRRPIASAA